MVGLLWTIIVLLFAFWLAGLLLHVAGGFIHLLLVIALALFLFNLMSGRAKV